LLLFYYYLIIILIIHNNYYIEGIIIISLLFPLILCSVFGSDMLFTQEGQHAGRMMDSDAPAPELDVTLGTQLPDLNRSLDEPQPPPQPKVEKELKNVIKRVNRPDSLS
jgi:hypothetical protein